MMSYIIYIYRDKAWSCAWKAFAHDDQYGSILYNLGSGCSVRICTDHDKSLSDSYLQVKHEKSGIQVHRIHEHQNAEKAGPHRNLTSRIKPLLRDRIEEAEGARSWVEQFSGRELQEFLGGASEVPAKEGRQQRKISFGFQVVSQLCMFSLHHLRHPLSTLLERIVKNSWDQNCCWNTALGIESMLTALER